MGDMPYGQCKYCHQIGPLIRTYYYFPIACDCCGPTHYEMVRHCPTCNPVMPNFTEIIIATKRLLDPITENLFKKVRE
jgi:hypothetical protein